MAVTLQQWHAKLALSFLRRGSRKTVLSERRHEGPLLVQKALYPEGPDVCHVAILHPPSGIAGGDVLSIDINVDAGAHALLTAPGAARWYKANGQKSRQDVRISLAAGARLDWLPPENIFFERTHAILSTDVELVSGACAIGWEICQLGSIMNPNHWDEGYAMLSTRLSLDGRPIWLETGELEADGIVRHSRNGLAGFPVMAALWAFGPPLTADQAESLAQVMPWNDAIRAGATHLAQKNGQSLCLVRVIGQHVEDVKQLLVAVWALLRPQILKMEAASLRLWAT
jgi:urease accessory protein